MIYFVNIYNKWNILLSIEINCWFNPHIFSCLMLMVSKYSSILLKRTYKLYYFYLFIYILFIHLFISLSIHHSFSLSSNWVIIPGQIRNNVFYCKWGFKMFCYSQVNKWTTFLYWPKHITCTIQFNSVYWPIMGPQGATEKLYIDE